MATSELRDTIRCSLLRTSHVPIEFAREPSRQQQLAHIFSGCDPATQERFRTAVVDCSAEWRTNPGPLTLLRDLGFLAYDVGAIDVIPILRHLVDRGAIRGPSKETSDEILGWVIATIGSFAPHPLAKAALQHFLLDGVVGDRHAGQLFLGLCVCEPELYWKYVPRFVEAARSLHCEFDVESILRRFWQSVSPRIIEAGLDAMKVPDSAAFQYFLREHLGFVCNTDFGDTADHPEVAYQRRVAQVRDPAYFGLVEKNALIALAERLERPDAAGPN